VCGRPAPLDWLGNPVVRMNNTTYSVPQRFVVLPFFLRINSLTAIDAHERQRFNELRGTVVSRRFFIRSQSLIAR